MTDTPGRLLDKYAKRPGEHGDADDANPETEDLGCFGMLRGVRDRALMLELRKTDGHVLAVGYSWIERAEFIPEEGIVLHLLGRKVRIKGSGLNESKGFSVRLFDGILRHRVPWVREMDHAALMNPKHQGPSIESITWDE